MAIRPKSRTVRSVLALFALCLVLPAMLVIGLMVASNVLEVRRSKEAELLAVAQSASRNVDLKVTRLATVASAIATSDSVQASDWVAARARIARLGLGSDTWVAIGNKSGRHLLNTSPVIGPPFSPPAKRLENIIAAARSGAPMVSNLFVGSSTGKKVVAVDQGVRDSADEVVVTVVTEPGALLPSTSELTLPAGAIITIVDRGHFVIARSRQHERWQGVLSTAPMIEAMRKQKEAVVPMRSLDGDPTTVAFKTSPLTGWTTLVVVPRKTVIGPAVKNGLAFAILGAAMLALGVALSHYFGTMLIRDLQRLEDDAAELGHGRLVASRRSGIENIDRVQAALSSASNELDVRASRQLLMINELNHRVKNTLATVQALAVQTFRTGSPDAAAAFNRRLVALAQAHDLLTQTSWEPVDIRVVVSRCAQSQSEHLAWSGPSAILPSQSAVALCMCLHELLTNAMKYGALSVGGGRVSLIWTVNEDGSIDLTWREEGGPSIAPTDYQGFGTKLIDRLARTDLDGEFTRELAEGGLRAKLRIGSPKSDRWRNDFNSS